MTGKRLLTGFLLLFVIAGVGKLLSRELRGARRQVPHRSLPPGRPYRFRPERRRREYPAAALGANVGSLLLLRRHDRA